MSLAKRLVGGTRLTEVLAERLANPHLVLAKTDGDLSAQVEALRRFIAENGIQVLNIAGPRASGEPFVGEYVRSLLNATLGQAGAQQK